MGIRSIKTGKFITPNKKPWHKTQCGIYFYLTDGDCVEVPDDEYEVYFSSGSKYTPVKENIFPNERGIINLNIVPRPFLLPGKYQWYDADFHIHSANRDDLNCPPITVGNIPIEIMGENICFGCIVDGMGKFVRYGENRYIIQGEEYRNGTYGHYLLFGNYRFSKFDREQYPPVKPFPPPLRTFNHLKQHGIAIICAHPITRCDINDISSWPGGGYGRGLLKFISAGLVDMITLADVSTDIDATKQLWYNLLNMGIKISAIGGSDICLGEINLPPAGSWRTYVYCEEENIDFERFLSYTRKGRAFISTGPMMEVDLNGAKPGDCVLGLKNYPTLNIKLNSPGVIEVVKVIIDGEVYDEFEVYDHRWEYKVKLKKDKGSWVCVECWGKEDWYYPVGLWAHSNPIYLSNKVDEQLKQRAWDYFDNLIAKLTQYLAMRGLSEEEIQAVLYHPKEHFGLL